MFKQSTKNKKADAKSTAFKKIIVIFLWIFIFCLFVSLGLNTYVCLNAKSNMYEIGDLSEQKSDCILVLGCGVKNGAPTPMLKDRLDTAIELYNKGVAPKILMSGDHGEKYYNEVGIMKVYAMKKGVPSKDIFMDHAGFSTYESLYRAKELFGIKNLVAVTQKYHLYRTVHLGKSLNIKAIGVSTANYNYGGMLHREVREILARDKDFFTALINPEPKMPLGDKISIMGDGNVTNDQAFFKIAEENNFNLP